MAVNNDPIFIDSWPPRSKTIYSGHSTRPVVIMTAGADGSRIHAMNIATSDAGDNTAKVYLLEEVTDQANMGTGALVDGGGGSDTITRSSGDFTTDGWKIGDRMLVAGATTLANDFLATLTNVASGTLTFATATVDTAENLPTGAKLYKATLLETVTVPDLSGTNGTDDAIDVLANLEFMPTSKENAHLTLGSGWGIAVAVGTAMGASEWLDVSIFAGDY